MTDQHGDILASVRDRRQSNLNPAQSVVEIFSQAPLVDHHLRFAVRGRDEANIHPLRLLSPDRPHFAVVDHAEQLCLKPRIEGLEFIEKKHPFVGLAQQTSPIPIGAGEGTPAVAEKFGLEKVRGRQSAVMRHEGPLADPRMRMDRPGNQFFTSARVTCDKHMDIASRGHQDPMPYLNHGFALPDQLRNRRIGDHTSTSSQQGAFDCQTDTARCRRLHQVVDCA